MLRKRENPRKVSRKFNSSQRKTHVFNRLKGSVMRGGWRL